ncbi:MAG TPA: TlpA disulfide reductase family protein [Acidobacteriota bacterium]|nr:TlpA disulfide reductase family protein [Acidobacteriota bacterium]
MLTRTLPIIVVLASLVTPVVFAQEQSPREAYYNFVTQRDQLRKQFNISTDEGRKQFMEALSPLRDRVAKLVESADPETMREDDLFFLGVISNWTENKEKSLAAHRTYLKKFPRGLFFNDVQQDFYKRLTSTGEIEEALKILPQLQAKGVDNYFENLSFLAWAYVRAEDKEKALETYHGAFEEIIRRAGHEQLPSYRLARTLPSLVSLYQEMDKRDEVLALLKDSLPKLDQAPDILDRVNTLITSLEIIDSQAPELAIERWVNGGGEAIGGSRGKVLLIDFWATWCGPCKKAIPGLKMIQEHYRGADFALVGLTKFYGQYMGERNLSKDDEASRILDDFVPKYEVTWPLGIADGDALFKSYGVTNLPTVFIIDKRGKVRERLVGHRPETEQEIMSTIDMLLKEK